MGTYFTPVINDRLSRAFGDAFPNNIESLTMLSWRFDSIQAHNEILDHNARFDDSTNFGRRTARGGNMQLRFAKSWIKAVDETFNNENYRRRWITQQLAGLPAGARILDAGAGSQQYKASCSHLDYVAQDFNQYHTDSVQTLISGSEPYRYGVADIVSDIAHIPVEDESFDHVLCSEVLEHVPKPVDTIRELARVLKQNGTLILTAPMNCLRHFDPYFFTSGLSDNWYLRILPEYGLEIIVLEPVGDYYSWMKVEVFRTIASNRWNPLTWVSLFPALVYFGTRRATSKSKVTLCMGYHVVARKLAASQL